VKAIVYYVDFHWDNHQGGSGKSFEFTLSIDVPENLLAVDLFEFIHKRIAERVKEDRPFQQGGRYSIQRVEIV
jgi:hypothetical protein